MFNLWLDKSIEVIDEIVAESNLKEIAETKISAFMKTEEFEEFIKKRIEISMERQIDEMIERAFDGDENYDQAMEKIQEILKRLNKS